MEYNFCGVVLAVSYDVLGNTAEIDVLSKKISEWLALSLGGGTFAMTGYRDDIELPLVVAPLARRDSDYTVVLYSDTPLITKKTVYDAITTLKQNNLNVLKLTRGWVFRTPYLLTSEKVYTDRTYFFDEEDFITVFNYRQLAMAREFLRNRILNFHLENGVDIEDLSSVFIGPDVCIEKGVRIAADNRITGKTIIKSGAIIEGGNDINECIISRHAKIFRSVLQKSFVGERTSVGPYSYIRPCSIIGQDCRVGDFVEIKNSKIADGCKISHLSYVGDAELGNDCNVGCGVVFCNYDGKQKYKTVVGNKVFIGSNSNLVAPLIIGDEAFIAAGSTITSQVPEKNLAIARARQENKPRKPEH